MTFLGQRSTVSRAVAASRSSSVGRASKSSDGNFAITAGIALAYRLGGHLPDQARSILIDASTPDRRPAVAEWDRALRGFVMLALQRLKSS
jgi:hypothetical protein